MAKWNNRKSQPEQQQVVDLSKPIVVDGTHLIAGRLASNVAKLLSCLLYTSPSPRDRTRSRMPSSA